MSDRDLEEKKEKGKQVELPEDTVGYDPKTPLYSKQHLCIYLRELYDLAEQEQEALKEKEDKMKNTDEDNA